MTPEPSVSCESQLWICLIDANILLSLLLVQLVGKEKLDIIAEVKDSNSLEVSKAREQWDELTRKIHHLEAEIDVSQALVRDMCAERDELRTMLDAKQTEIRAEDQDFMKEIQELLAEFAAKVKNENPDAPEKSGIELLKHFAEVAEKSAETLAKRAEVSEKAYI